MSERKSHWENVYQTKEPDEVSWTQEIPQTSLDFINSFKLPKSSKIIDIGGGDSRLVDYLLDQGYSDITVLDISEAALKKAKNRLGEKSELVKWIVFDITTFQATELYDIWHDRATFHFLTNEDQIETYLSTARKAVSNYMVIGTFSENGPDKCSGLPIRKYNEEQLKSQLNNGFIKIRCIEEDHLTPFQTRQNFLFCSFKRL
ncbi:tellurite resistance protein TehB [compost metagenome]